MLQNRGSVIDFIFNTQSTKIVISVQNCRGISLMVWLFFLICLLSVVWLFCLFFCWGGGGTIGEREEDVDVGSGCC